jgi:hypothetical protein
VRRNWQARRLARIAKVAGLARAFPGRGPLVLRKIRRLKEKHGAARDVWIIGSTGARTFADPGGELHEVLKRCRSARIMLLNPSSEGARTRVKSILAPEVTLDQFRDQIIRSLDFLRGLKGAQKTIRLKLYETRPLKLAILGDHAWVKLYHRVWMCRRCRSTPSSTTRTRQSPHRAVQYCLRAWESAPEYDLETDEVVYRDRRGRELKRVPFGEPVPPSGADVAGAVDSIEGICPPRHFPACAGSRRDTNRDAAVVRGDTLRKPRRRRVLCCSNPDIGCTPPLLPASGRRRSYARLQRPWASWPPSRAAAPLAVRSPIQGLAGHLGPARRAAGAR